ncbi:MAG: DUF488 family protein [Nitrospira sp.]
MAQRKFSRLRGLHADSAVQRGGRRTYGASMKVAIMCAEAVPWRCHRSLIADALVSRNWDVRHIMSEGKADPHRLTSFARVNNGQLHYPQARDDSCLFP